MKYSRVCVVGLVAMLCLGHAQALNYCSTCIAVAGAIEDKGIDMACDYIGADAPPLSTLCHFIVDHVGEWILDHAARGYNDTTMCKQLGFCSAQGCVCGECASPVFDTRCLSLPNKCPSTSPLLDGGADAPTPAPALFVPALRGNSDGSSKLRNDAHDTGADEFCFDGDCDSSHVGCCLTCF